MALSKKVQRSLDPNNKFWSNDKNRFGYKILKKYGWSDDKGLGLNEDGRTEYIKTKIKKDNLGLGADLNSDGWLSTSTDFDNVLSKLASVNGKQPSNALEKKFESSPDIEHERPGLGSTQFNESISAEFTETKIIPKHFIPKKVFKAKNALYYNKNDLDMVLGKPVIKPSSDNDQKQEDKILEHLEKESNLYERKSSMSIQDYFKNKMAMKSLKDIDLKDLEDEESVKEEKKRKKRKNSERKKDKKDKKTKKDKKDKKEKKKKKKKKRAKHDES